MKPKDQPAVKFVRKLRSKLPHRRRLQVSPILYSNAKEHLIASPVDSSASSKLTREVSCDSSRVSVNKPIPSLKKRSFEEIGCFGEIELRRVTRSYCRQGEGERKEEQMICVEDGKVKPSESSCVESCSGVDSVDTRERISKFKRTDGKGAGNANEFGGTEDSEAIATSEVSCVQQFPGEFYQKIFTSGGEKGKGTSNPLDVADNEVVLLSGENRVSTVELAKVSQSCAVASLAVSNSESTIEQKSKLDANDTDLACSENYEDLSDYSSAFTDLQSEIFQESSDLDFSDYTSSSSFESGSEFSERSSSDSSPSATFSLFLQYRQQFSKSTYLDSELFSRCEDEQSNEIKSLSFEDDEHEMSYRMLRNRERRQVYLHDYAEEYGDLIIQQRMQMVHWIIEQFTAKELQKETMFLGVSLLDRFLSKGFFKNKRNLQIVGIACLTLATRIEENQPYNSVRQKIFSLGGNAYSRYEVVAMEWLVQEVLNFQCFLPTIYNFLWFYLKAARANEEVEKTTEYLAKLVLLGHEQLCYWPSTIAAGLVILASLAANQDASCDHVMETHIRTQDDDLPGCIKSLEWLVKYAC